MLTDSGPAAPAPLDPEIVRRIEERVVSDVADMPRFSPEDQPDMMLVTADELRDFVEDAVREFLGAVQAERPREPSVEDLLALADRMPNATAELERGDYTLRMLLRIVAGTLGGLQATARLEHP